MSWTSVLSIGFPVLVLLALALYMLKLPPIASGVLALAGGVVVLFELDQFDRASWGYWFLLATTWMVAWLFAERVANRQAHGHTQSQAANVLIPAMFGAAILVVWEAITRGSQVPPVLPPPPSSIGRALSQPVPTLAVDLVLTFKAVLIGFALAMASLSSLPSRSTARRF